MRVDASRDTLLAICSLLFLFLFSLLYEQGGGGDALPGFFFDLFSRPRAGSATTNMVIFSGHDPFNGWGGAGSNNFVPVLGGDGTKIALTGDIFGQPPVE